MLTLYPVASKQKSLDICRAFAAGAPKHAEGAVFFGVNDSNVREFNRVRREGRDWWYLDNAYLDKYRGVYFRATKNALQCSGAGESDGKRFAKLDIEIKPWRTVSLGTDILICEQSASFMRTAVGYKGDWTKDTLARLPAGTRVRPWSPDKVKARTTLFQELPGLRLVVTHSSGSAITAMLEGVPAISEAGAANWMTGPLCPAAIVDPPRPENRERFARVLADNQWRLDEFREGVAWRMLNK